MRKKPKYKIFILTFEKWRKFFCLTKIPIIRDNRMDCQATLCDCRPESKKVELRYNTKALKGLLLAVVVGDALHELGHYIHGLPYGTFKNKVKAEYEAERFSLNMLKIHYPAYYRQVINCVRATIHEHQNPNDVHDVAFNMIKEYKIKKEDNA